MAGAVIGLDYGAIIVMGAALGADLELLAEVLPMAEPAIVSAFAVDRSED